MAKKLTRARSGNPHPPLQLLTYLSQAAGEISPLLILTHDFPDPDALASAWGLQHLVRSFGIDSRIVYGGVITRAENRAMVKLLKIPAHKLKARELARAKHVALVDTQPAFDNNPFPETRRATLVLDQHSSAAPVDADLAIVDTECGATCSIVAQALLLKDVEMPPPLATALAYGILSDTLDLYRVEREDVIQTYLRVLRRSDMRALAEIQNPQRSRRFFTTLRRSLQTATAHKRVVVAHLGTVPGPETVAHIAEYLLAYERADWSLCTGRLRGNLYLSLRTEVAGAEAGHILRQVVEDPDNAGGHGGIAGGRIPLGAKTTDSEWENAELALQSRLAKSLGLAPEAEFRRLFT